MRKHSGLKQWQCEHCEKAFEKYTSLKSHIAVKHYDEAEGKPEFICDVDGCGKTYSLKVNANEIDSIRWLLKMLFVFIFVLGIASRAHSTDSRREKVKSTSQQKDVRTVRKIIYQ